MHPKVVNEIDNKKKLISNFFLYESVASHKANSHHFKNMVVGAQKLVCENQFSISNNIIFLYYSCKPYN